VLPDSVTARCDQVFSGSAVVPLICCSPAAPEVVMAKRGAVPALTVRNMFAVVPVPKSKTRDQVEFAAGFTQTEIVKLARPLTTPVGRAAYSLLPLSFTALPILPGTSGPVAPPPRCARPDGWFRKSRDRGRRQLGGDG